MPIVCFLYNKIMESKQENKEEIYKRLNILEKEVENIKKNLNIENIYEDDDQKKYEISLTSGNRSFLKVLSILVISFFIIILISRIISN